MSESPEPPTNVTIHPALDKTRDAVVRSGLSLRRSPTGLPLFPLAVSH